ncbi:lamina-associated polypeptide 2-like [Rana temporaria]|uniref:lamina-associated polypeptide 2-like n=1 Tax=Rana temporaria TaxID=8407 RepID=UPI001AAD5C0C|nr:lamina-associated polypeptide 2-like [Rana temporaria]
MYQGMDDSKHRVFPVHKVLSDTVKKEWKDPEKGPFLPKSLKRRFPFENKETEVWNKKPRVDAAFSQVSRRTDLAFEDMGVLKDAMDKRADALLKKAWDSASASLKPAMASTVVTRNLECWVEKLKGHIEAGTHRKDLLDSFPLILNAIKYMADASAESIKMAARSSALVNSARRAVWLKTWSGDTASKIKLCGIPFSGDFLFGPDLETVLDRTADKKKAFPAKKKQTFKKEFSCCSTTLQK